MVATGARPVTLGDFKTPGADLKVGGVGGGQGKAAGVVAVVAAAWCCWSTEGGVRPVRWAGNSLRSVVEPDGDTQIRKSWYPPPAQSNPPTPTQSSFQPPTPQGVHYLRNVVDADSLVAAIKAVKEAGGQVGTPGWEEGWGGGWVGGWGGRPARTYEKGDRCKAMGPGAEARQVGMGGWGGWVGDWVGAWEGAGAAA